MRIIFNFIVCFTILNANAQTIGGNVLQAEKIHNIFNQLRADNLEILDGFYHPDVEFVDPVGKHHGRESVKRYYQNLYQNVKEIRFEKINHVAQDNNHVYFWRMVLKTPSIKNGEEFAVEGNSHIIFNQDNLVIYHRDFFDMGEFVYENIPVLKSIIKYIKNRLKHD
jgi:hypothetical protein